MMLFRKVSGFSLIELIIVIAIMAIAASIGTISFNSWQTKNKIEGQTREIYNDLNLARANAFQQKREHRVIFQPSSYVMKSYSSEFEPVDSGQTVLSKADLKFGLTRRNGTTLALDADISDCRVIYDTRGYATGLPTAFETEEFYLIVNPYAAGSSVNCMVISATRVNLGKINGTTCEFR